MESQIPSLVPFWPPGLGIELYTFKPSRFLRSSTGSKLVHLHREIIYTGADPLRLALNQRQAHGQTSQLGGTDIIRAGGQLVPVLAHMSVFESSMTKPHCVRVSYAHIKQYFDVRLLC